MSDAEPTIPKSRFDERVRQAKEAEAAAKEQIAHLTGQIETLTGQAAQSETLAQQVAQLTADLAGAGQTHGRQMAATRAGITDPDDMADALALYAHRAPEGVAFADWLSGDSLPRSVRALLPQPAAAALQPAPGQPAPGLQGEAPPNGQPVEAPPNGQFTGAELPRPNGGVVTRRPTSPLPTVSDIHSGVSSDDQHKANRIAMGLPPVNQHAARRGWGRS